MGRSRNRVKIGPAPQHWYLGICTSTGTYKILLIDLSYRRFTRRSLNTNRYLKMLCIALPVLHLKGQCHAILTPHFFVQNATGARYLEPLQKLEVKNFAKQ